MVKALLNGFGDLGNDSPFAPMFPSTDTSVPQRKQDLAKAKQLLAAAGHPNGFSDHAHTEKYQEIPELAQVIAGGRDQDRRQLQAQGRDPDQLLRQGDVRQLRLARCDRQPRRLRRPRRPERVPRGAADLGRTVERRALQEQDVRHPGQAVRRRPSTSRPRSRSRARSRTCCSRRRRSCSRTSSTP